MSSPADDLKTPSIAWPVLLGLCGLKLALHLAPRVPRNPISRQWDQFQRFFHVDRGARTASRANNGVGPEQ
jgi:hypothetical protein